MVSDTNFRDPERWRRFTPTPDLRRVLFRRFLASNPDSVFICPNGHDKPVRWHYTAGDLAFARSYADSTGRKLVALGLPSGSNNCGDLIGAEWSPHWFYLANDTLALGAELELVDAGDYDGDGESELIFWHSGYDEDGYTLFYRRFRARTDFFWAYH